MASNSQHESELISLISEICSVFETIKSKEPTLGVGLSWHPQRHYTKSPTDLNLELESKLVSLLTQIISVFSSMDMDTLPKPHSVFVSHITQIISAYKSLRDSEPDSELVSLVSQIISIGSSKGSSHLEIRRSAKLSILFEKIFTLTPEPELVSLVNELMSLVQSPDVNPTEKFISLLGQLYNYIASTFWEPSRELVPLITEGVSLVRSMDLESQPRSEYKSRINQMIALFSSLSKSEPESKVVLCITEIMHLVFSVDKDLESRRESGLVSVVKQLINLKPEPEIVLLFVELSESLMSRYVKTGSESDLISLIGRLASLLPTMYLEPDPALVYVLAQVIAMAYDLDLSSSWEPKSVLKSPITQIISLITSTVESDPKDSELVSLLSQVIKLICTVPLTELTRKHDFLSLLKQLFSLEPEPEVITLVNNMLSQYKTVKWKPQQWISLSPQVEVKLKKGKFCVIGKIQREKEVKGTCNKEHMDFHRLNGDSIGYFRCTICNGQDHEEFEKAPIEVEHPQHPEHALQLALLTKNSGTRECFCCDEDLKAIFYYCSDCDHAMNLSCMGKQLTFDIYHPEWREQHDMLLFPRRVSLTCNVCAVPDSSSPIYLCPPCDFVIHQKCLSLPSVIEISRHPHRISFTPSFDLRDLSCRICQKDIDYEYGGYSCIKEGCSYVAHSRCATRKTLWDGKELKGQPEEEDKEVRPFVRINDGVIQHFSHKRHYLRLDKDTSRDYDENKKCRACVTPIYDGNFYSCMKCEFILHETCANLPRKKHHPIHPHPLTLMRGYGGIVNTKNSCSACPWLCTGFFYQCDVEGCDLYKLHVQCATISEPLVHASHMHPLFLTSDPGVERTCWDCKGDWTETFNCIKCDFALCYGCATLPQKVRYKHDKHMLTLSYGDETSTVISWCEICEEKLKPKERVYRCDEYCSVTLHTQCLFGGDFYMKPSLSLLHLKGKIDLLRNNHHMDRPFCTYCKRRCSGRNVFQCFGSIYCSRDCICYGIKFGE